MIPTAQEAFDRIIALRQLTIKTGTVTNRVQNRILQSASDDDLIQLAVALKSVNLPVGGGQ